MDKTTIGVNAGIVWRTIDSSGRAWKYEELKKETKLSDRDLNAAIGWLARENKIEFPDLLRFQDPPFFLNCMKIAGKFFAIPKVVYCYRKGENIVKWDSRKVHDLLEGILFEVAFSKKNKFSDLHRIAVDHINVEFEKNIRPFVNFDNIVGFFCLTGIS